MMRRLVSRSLVALIVGVVVFALPVLAQTTLLDLDGHPKQLTDLVKDSGKDATVLVVWCSRCGSCRGVERDLDAFAAANSDRVKLYVVSPHPADDSERIRSFLKGQDLHLEALRDAEQAFVIGHKIERTTTALVFDKEGKLRYFGPFQGDGGGFAADAVEQVLAGDEVAMKTRPQRGCPIPRS